MKDLEPKAAGEFDSSTAPALAGQVTAGWRQPVAGRRHLVVAVARPVVFVLTPWSTFGWGTPLLFVLAAIRRRGSGGLRIGLLWACAALYTGVLAVEVAAIVIAAPDAQATTHLVAGLCLAVTVVGGGLHALGFVVLAAVKGVWPLAAPSWELSSRERSCREGSCREGSCREGSCREALSQGRRAGAGSHESVSERDRASACDSVSTGAGLIEGRRHRDREPRRHREAVGAVVGAASAVFLIPVGTGLIVEAREFAAHHQVTDGIVTGARESTDCGSTGCTTSYETTISYPVPGGRHLRFEATRSARAAIGTHLQVYYDVFDPRDARLDAGSDELVGGLLLFALSALLLLLTWLSSVAPHRHRRRSLR
jgi:hypothetical protein